MTAQNQDSQPVSIEAEYLHRGESHSSEWTFESLLPGQARDRVITGYVPLDATLHRYAVWHGRSEDRPGDDNGNEFISLDEIENTTDR